ncbi:MAG TPA: PilZ domain-containing protein [Terriglobia bacterium]|nr:PilZ domain-containing protein [Candidatus Acidoferrum sp.]HMD85274.1 PilZ domain-containing protein [Terriglobia bacterium]
MPVPDQRKYPRVKPPRTFVVAWRSGMTRDVSYMDSLALGGLFIRTRRPVPLRSSVQLLLDTPAGQIRGRAIVRRVHEKAGMGLQIIAMDPGDRALLHRELRDLFAA